MVGINVTKARQSFVLSDIYQTVSTIDLLFINPLTEIRFEDRESTYVSSLVLSEWHIEFYSIILTAKYIGVLS